uniref:EF-hand calcium binding domain 6 n=1 Tax=Latimeria chalumnae TaxID=7897 RepID=H3AMC0_LATCH
SVCCQCWTYSKGAPSLFDDSKTVMTQFTRSPNGTGLRNGEQLSRLIKDLLKSNFQGVELAFNELDEMNTRRLAPEAMYQLLKCLVNLGIQPRISREEVGKLWETIITNQDETVDFFQFVRHFGFSAKSACYPNAKISPPVKGDSDFLIRSRKMNSDTEIAENTLRAKVEFLLDDLWTHFRELDPLTSGFVSKEAFKDTLTELCPELSDYQCEALITKFDHGENQISYIDFLQPFEDRKKVFKAVHSKTFDQKQAGSPLYTETMQKGLSVITSNLRQKMAGDWKTLLKACKKLDVSSSGFLLLPEFRSIMKLCNIILDEDEIYHIMSHFDKGMAGKIDYSKFITEALKKQNINNNNNNLANPA